PGGEHDRRYVRDAIACAKRRSPAMAGMVFDFVERILLKQATLTTPEACAERARFIGKFQQVTSPVAAKGIEDSTLYVYNRLLALRGGGWDPPRSGGGPRTVHGWTQARLQQGPHALSAPSTHDSKRGEDVRAGLDVLSKIPSEGKAAVSKWRALNRRWKT